MWSWNKKSQSNSEMFNSLNSIIAEGMYLKAESFTGSSGLEIRGVVTSDVDIDGPLIIHDAGVLNGNVSCTFCRVEGSITGDITVNGTLEILEGGSVKGDIHVQALSIELGGTFSGKCNQPKGYVRIEEGGKANG